MREGFALSRQFNRRAFSAIAHGALTNSKRPSCFVGGEYPTHIEHGHGCYLYDVDGNRYTDFICALGTNLWGYSHPRIVKAVFNQIDSGVLFSLSSRAEVEFSEVIKERFLFIERLRILKTGSEGCLASIRIARAATGRKIIFSHAYHGWGDEFISLTPPAIGVCEHRYIKAGWEIEDIDGSVAGVIVEPVITDYSPERRSYLEKLRKKCTDKGVVLIFDETITALRFPSLCVANYLGITPDIIIFGKALGAGFPLSIVGGKKEIMESDYFVSSTFAGETVSMAAAEAVLNLSSLSEIQRIWDEARLFQEDFNKLNPDLIKLEGYPTRGVIKAKDDLTRALFFQSAIRAGLLFGPSYFWCEPHATERSRVLAIVSAILDRIKNDEVKLEGDMPVTPFAQRVREGER